MLGSVGAEGNPEQLVCGVWYPDGLAPGIMMWRGSGFTSDRREFNFDPFPSAVLPAWTVEGFTERLGDEDRSLQCAMSSLAAKT